MDGPAAAAGYQRSCVFEVPRDWTRVDLRAFPSAVPQHAPQALQRLRNRPGFSGPAFWASFLGQLSGPAFWASFL